MTMTMIMIMMITTNRSDDKVEPVVDLQARLLVVGQVVPANHHQHALTRNLVIMAMAMAMVTIVMIVMLMMMLMTMTLYLCSSKGCECPRHRHFSATHLPNIA